MKTKIKDDNTETNKKNEIKVLFVNTYIGKLGTFYRNKEYTIPVEIFKLLKMDCKEI